MTDDDIMAIAIQQVPGARGMRADLLDFARAILAAAPVAAQEPTWTRIEDALPPAETDVLVRKVYGCTGEFDVAGLFHDAWQSAITQDYIKGEVTHWRPLPDAP